jgi:transcriptional regulator with XRE-family HTH domain
MVDSLAIKIRAKKLGILLRDARQTKGKSMEECAQVLGVPTQSVLSFELGDEPPSLPELEVLAYYLDVPMGHFWGQQLLTDARGEQKPLDVERFTSLRQRMIGVQVREAREELGLSAGEVAEQIGISEPQLFAYETGEQSIPVPDLDALTDVLNMSIGDIQDRRGPVGKWSAERRAVEDFLTLPEEVQHFVSKPVNRPYLELAQRLSEMSVEKLRAVAEGLLEITL